MASPTTRTQAHLTGIPYPPSTLRMLALVEESRGPAAQVRLSEPRTRGCGQLHMKLPRVFKQP